MVLKEKKTGSLEQGWEIKVHVESPTVLSYEVIMTDVKTGKGQIRFNLPVNLQWLKENFSTFFVARLYDDAQSAGEVTEVTVLGYGAEYAG